MCAALVKYYDSRQEEGLLAARKLSLAIQAIWGKRRVTEPKEGPCILSRSIGSLLFALGMLAMSAAAFAQVRVGVAITMGRGEIRAGALTHLPCEPFMPCGKNQKPLGHLLVICHLRAGPPAGP